MQERHVSCILFYLKSGKEQPQALHADRFDFNAAYSISAYSKGAVFLDELGYVIGEENLTKPLQRVLYELNSNIPIRMISTAEKVSGLQLDWYMNYWTETTEFIDYVVEGLSKNNIELMRKAACPCLLTLQLPIPMAQKKISISPWGKWWKQTPPGAVYSKAGPGCSLYIR